ncbi:MAG: murein hydrolase activator EnvC family protein [Balneolaceae bacterium]
MSAEWTSAQNSYDDRRAQILERQNNARNQIQVLNRQIQDYNERLSFASERFDQQYNQYQELTRLIALQQQKINSMNEEQRQIIREIDLIEENMLDLEQRLSNLIEQYKETLTYLYKYGRTTELALLLTSSSMNQLLVRSFYLSKFDDYRQTQANEIRAAQQDLEKARNDLEVTKNRNMEALAAIENELEMLAERERQQNRNIELLRRDRNNIRNQLSIVEQQAEQLNNALSRLIEEEERIRRAAETGSGETIRHRAFISIDELAAFEAEFSGKKGSLPWPVENGTITEHFGVRTHPVFATKTNNPGIDIATPSQSSVYVVSDGYVYGIEPLKGYGTVVFVNHGNYNTAYGNLSDVFVRKNQVLRQGDVIGLSGNENSIKGEVLFFLIREGRQNVNPVQWLQKSIP